MYKFGILSSVVAVSTKAVEIEGRRRTHMHHAPLFSGHSFGHGYGMPKAPGAPGRPGNPF